MIEKKIGRLKKRQEDIKKDRKKVRKKDRKKKDRKIDLKKDRKKDRLKLWSIEIIKDRNYNGQKYYRQKS